MDTTKSHLVDFVFDTFELAEQYDADGLNGEAAGIRETLKLLAEKVGISKAVLHLARQGAREYAERLQSAE